MWLGAFIYTTFSLFSVAAWADDPTEHVEVGSYVGKPAATGTETETYVGKCEDPKVANRGPEHITAKTMDRICILAHCQIGKKKTPTERTYYFKQALQKYKYEVLNSKLEKGQKGICVGDAAAIFRKRCGTNENGDAMKNIIPTIENYVKKVEEEYNKNVDSEKHIYNGKEKFSKVDSYAKNNEGYDTAAMNLSQTNFPADKCPLETENKKAEFAAELQIKKDQMDAFKKGEKYDSEGDKEGKRALALDKSDKESAAAKAYSDAYGNENAVALPDAPSGTGGASQNQAIDFAAAHNGYNESNPIEVDQGGYGKYGPLHATLPSNLALFGEGESNFKSYQDRINALPQIEKEKLLKELNTMPETFKKLAGTDEEKRSAALPTITDFSKKLEEAEYKNALATYTPPDDVKPALRDMLQPKLGSTNNDGTNKWAYLGSEFQKKLSAVSSRDQNFWSGKGFLEAGTKTIYAATVSNENAKIGLLTRFFNSRYQKTDFVVTKNANGNYSATGVGKTWTIDKDGNVTEP